MPCRDFHIIAEFISHNWDHMACKAWKIYYLPFMEIVLQHFL